MNRLGIAIGFCTFRRPRGLARLLANIELLDDLPKLTPKIIIVDNDGRNPEVQTIVDDFRDRSGFVVEYVIETKPGIAAARNAVFRRADELAVRFLAMLDDDEWPTPGWLKNLLSRQAETGVDVIGGPVRPVFPPDASRLDRFARFWSVNRQQLRGKCFVFCTCNFLIDLEAIEAHPRPLFDERFGLTGGEDTMFFRSLFFTGHEMDWADDALLQEEVPSERASFRWIRRRHFWSGNCAVRWEEVSDGRVRPLLKTLAISLRLLVYPLLRGEKDQWLWGWLLEFDKIRGRYSAHTGRILMEYASNP